MLDINPMLFTMSYNLFHKLVTLNLKADGSVHSNAF